MAKRRKTESQKKEGKAPLAIQAEQGPAQRFEGVNLSNPTSKLGGGFPQGGENVKVKSSSP